MRSKKKIIEIAYTKGEEVGLSVWCTDQAGPFQTKPFQGINWQPEGHPAKQPHEYIRNGTAKLMTLFHPKDGNVVAKGVTGCSNDILHSWLKEELTKILDSLPPMNSEQTIFNDWEFWYKGLKRAPTRPKDLPPLRLLLILDNLAGHKTHEFVLWCFRNGIALIYTPLGGSWLNMAESIQRIIKSRALDGQNPSVYWEIIDWLEAAVRGWNKNPTPFVWKGKRFQRRRKKLHDLSGSGASVQVFYTKRILNLESLAA